MILSAATLLAACSPNAPKGTDKATLDEAVSRAVGDPNTCVMLAERGSGRVVYRYNTATTCDRAWPACDGPELRKLKDLAAQTAKDGQARMASCDTTPDGSRGVGWAAGPIAGQKSGKPLVYAAVMEGDRVFPGRMMADRLARAWTRAGLSTAQP
ncbi:hypothetical protein [Phenylobacterium sp.]|jgi:hypothetical protein|uniref:hypothetical protein n=1 Tax=Phenylobacterium sp. TaxID=1871053 RepID=UPI0037851C4D